LSAKKDEAGTSMLRFFQEHMVLIMRPVNEHIDVLRRKQSELERACNSTEKAIDNVYKRLDRHDEVLEALDSKHGLLDREFRKMQSEWKSADLVEKVVELEAESRKEKKARMQVDDRVDRQASVMQALHASLDESTAANHRVELKLWQTASLSERIERDVVGLREENRSLNDRQFSLSRGLERLDDALEQAVKRVLNCEGAAEAARREVSTAIPPLDDRIKGIEAAIPDLVLRLDGCEGPLKTIGEQVASMREDMGHISQDIHRLEEENEKQDEEAARALQKTETALEEEVKRQATVAQRVKEVEVELAEVKSTLATELEKKCDHDTVSQLSLRVDTQDDELRLCSSNAQGMEVTQSAHEQRLLNLEARAGDAESAQADLTKRADLAHTSIGELFASHETVRLRIDGQHEELEKVEAQTSTTRHALGQTNAAVQYLHGDLGTTKGGLEKTAMRLDLAHEYIHGISRGLQETHKLTLAGQDGMLAPKNGSDRTQPLPMIGLTSRPRSARGKTMLKLSQGAVEEQVGA
jgi:chromosome segregation ATPase